MEKLTSLSAKENSGEQLLEGMYRITVDINLSADDKIVLPALEELLKVSVLPKCEVEDYQIEKHLESSAFTTGDTIEITSEFTCEKSVYVDTNGNLVITDSPVSQCVESVGTYPISLPEGTIAEINSQSRNDVAEVLFSGLCVEVPELRKTAFLGILKLPSNILARYDK